MLQRATVVLNLVAAVTMVLTAIYVFIVFSDIVSPGARMMIGFGAFVYSTRQIQAAGNSGNKN